MEEIILIKRRNANFVKKHFFEHEIYFKSLLYVKRGGALENKLHLVNQSIIYKDKRMEA